MKKQTPVFALAVAAVLMLAASFYSCNKKDDTVDNNNDSTSQQIDSILPPAFNDSLKAHNFPLNSGNTPPTINGIYLFEAINDYDNSSTFSVGEAADDSKFKIANQHGTSADVYIKGSVTTTSVDTSSAQIIAGTGNDFTIYARSHGGSPVYTYDYVVTGSYSTAGIKDFKLAFVVIDDGGNSYIASTGTVRIFHDKDSSAAATDVFRLMTPENIKKAIGSR